MALRILITTLVLLVAGVGGNSELLSDLLSPAGHSCGESCCCDAEAPATGGAGWAADAGARPATAGGCCATEAIMAPQLRAGCTCGPQEEHATAPVVASISLPETTVALVATTPRLARAATRRQIPLDFQCAPDPPPPRGA